MAEKSFARPVFGRIGKRFDQAAYGAIVGALESATGKPLSPAQRGVIVRGADEVDLVNSGLEETMAYAYHEIREIWKSNPEVGYLRTAAFVSAINKIAVAYGELGIFP